MVVKLTGRFILLLLLSAVLLSGQSDSELFRQSVTAQQQGDFASAAAGYREILKAHPDSVDARANLAACLVHLGQFDQAINEYRAALRLAPNLPALRMNLALAYYKKGDFRSAESEFSRLRQALSADIKAAILDADCLSKLGDYKRAIDVLAPLEQQNRDNLDLAYVLGAALLHTGDLHSGADLLERVGKQGSSADAYFLAGSALLTASQTTHNLSSRALDDLRAARALDPKFPGLLTKLGIAEEGAGNSDEAERLFKQAIASNPSDFDANVHLAGIYYGKRDLEEAGVYADVARTLQPKSPFVLYQSALIEAARGQTEKAVTDFESVVQQSPDWVDPHRQLSILYYRLHRNEAGLKERHEVDRLSSGEK